MGGNGRFGGAALALGVVLLVGLVVGAGANSVGASQHAAPAKFEPGPCPKPTFPIPALKNAHCGFLVVPENRAKPGGRTIRLAVAIVPAESSTPAADPIVHMSGGPGVPAILEIPSLIAAGLNRDRDLIVMDQRGQLYSKPQLTCPEIDRFNARAVGLRPYAASTGRRHVKATRRCHRRLAARNIDLGAYNTTENAADFADLRKALGIAKWNVYGSSYGTDLALTYMREHPQGIRSVTIDSVVPPHVATLSWTWTSVKQGFHGLFRACAAQRGCHNHYPHLGRTFARLVRKLQSHPLVTRARPAPGVAPVKVVLDGAAIVNWLVGAPGFAPAGVPAAIDELAHGDPRNIAKALASAAGPDVAKFPLGYGLNYGVFCGEWVPYERRSAVLRRGRHAFPAYPRSVLDQAPQLPFMTEDCRAWKVPKAPAAQRAITRSTIPTLVLSGSFDSRTAPRWGEYAARTLPNSTFVKIPGVGHVVAPKSDCAQRVLASFLATPGAPNTGCVAGLKPPKFTVGP
jgi:pimeloyl-ACP methyl ester carboxylesterase